MPPRLVPIDEGPDIMLDRGMVVVGRHPGCDARLDSPRVSRHHCCVMPEDGEVLVRDLGSTNGVRINGQRVEAGRLKPGDELSIAHLRYRLEEGREPNRPPSPNESASLPERSGGPIDDALPSTDEDVLAAAVRRVLPASIAEKCRIQVIVEMIDDSTPSPEAPSQSPLEEPPKCPSS